ncbi:MAG: hypothetical protein ACE5D3_08960, partial [Candidatus Binatia bacterium]
MAAGTIGGRRADAAEHPSRVGLAIRSVASALFVVLLPVLLVTSIIRVLISDVGFYEWGLRRHEAESRT